LDLSVVLARLLRRLAQPVQGLPVRAQQRLPVQQAQQAQAALC
jgi:hypothetical protein